MQNNNIDYQVHLNNQAQDKKSFLLGTVASTLMFLALPFVSNLPARISLSTSLLSLGVMLNKDAEKIHRSQLLLDDISDIETTKSNNIRFLSALRQQSTSVLDAQVSEVEVKETPVKEAPSKQSEDIPTYEIFSPFDFVNAPHIALFGRPGSGKSALANFITEDVLAEQKKIYLNPHHYGDCVKVQSEEEAFNWFVRLGNGEVEDITVGCGRDFESISYFLRAAERYMTWRYDNGADLVDWDFINIVTEEGVALSTHEHTKEAWKAVQTSIVTESRKVNMRLIFVCQGRQVDITGAKGRSDIRSCYLWVHIGKMALSAANLTQNKDLIRQIRSDMDESVRNWERAGKPGGLFSGAAYLITDDCYVKKDTELVKYMPLIDLTANSTEKFSPGQIGTNRDVPGEIEGNAEHLQGHADPYTASVLENVTENVTEKATKSDKSDADPENAKNINFEQKTVIKSDKKVTKSDALRSYNDTILEAFDAETLALWEKCIQRHKTGTETLGKIAGTLKTRKRGHKETRELLESIATLVGYTF